jgi:hypothetical protein
MDTVLFVSGHLTDAPDRAPQRFPDTRHDVDRVQDQMRRMMVAWQVEPGWTLVTGGGCGHQIRPGDQQPRTASTSSTREPAAG